MFGVASSKLSHGGLIKVATRRSTGREKRKHYRAFRYVFNLQNFSLPIDIGFYITRMNTVNPHSRMLLGQNPCVCIQCNFGYMLYDGNINGQPPNSRFPFFKSSKKLLCTFSITSSLGLSMSVNSPLVCIPCNEKTKYKIN